MLQFWETVVNPVLEALQPRSIVEIGSDKGHNTQNLLEFCQRTGAKLHVIDPSPEYNVSEWEEEYGEHAVFHQALSLNALSRIDEMDVVLVDGDHNWYTVFNELKLIEQRCTDLSRPFPLVMLHDIGWPYGRRDLYYDPENIPEAYRKPYKQKGLRPASGEPLEQGGLNPSLHNSIRENDLQSGVLTALEDFLKETEQQLELIELPGLHGLGILIPLHLKEQNREFTELMESLSLPQVIERHLQKTEESRIEAMISAKESNAALKSSEKELRQREKELEEKDAKLAKAKRESQGRIRELNAALEDLKAEHEREAEELRQRIKRLEEQNNELNKRILALAQHN